ncbi:tRNA dihydrouridine synthase [Symmachiella macrocystis]|nr:tRNA-dihydrouridine synthase [Symmachiella macrocystis]
MKTADQHPLNAQSATVSPAQRPFGDEDPRICIGGRIMESRYFLSPLAGYTHLAFRQVVRELGGLGLATTDLVLANQLSHKSRKSMELIATNDADRPLSVQIYGGVNEELVRAARWLEAEGYEGIDLNMGCPMAKITGNGGGARLMCDVDNASRAVSAVIEAVEIPVTVKMRLGWDREHITAPMLARAFEQLGVAAITIHGRTRQQGFHGNVQLEGIRETVAAVERIPVIGNGDVRTVEDAIAMRRITGCAAVAIGRGALMDPWIFHRLQRVNAGDTSVWEPPAEAQIEFLERHFRLMLQQHGETMSCLMFRKFAAWNGARLGIPEDLEDRLRRFESEAEFAAIVEQIRQRHGERKNPRPTAEVRVPNGPVERW